MYITSGTCSTVKTTKPTPSHSQYGALTQNEREKVD